MILEPWPHIIANDYVTDTFAKLLIKFSEEKIKNKEFEKFTFGEYEFPQELKDQHAIYKYTVLSKCEELLNLFPQVRRFNANTNLKLRTTLFVLNTGYVHPVHNERIDKVISIVTYLAPEQGIGTHIYNIDKSYNKTVEWNPGTTLIFAGLEGVTWHSFESGQTYRVTLNTFLENEDLTSIYNQYASLLKPGDTGYDKINF
jgi:hypothetical protein